MIRVSELHLALGGVDVLSGVSLTVDRGELVGLVGPNGAGKTTLLRTINGVLDPDAGTVTLDGTDRRGADAATLGRLVATVPQDTHVAFGFTAEQVVEMGRAPHRSRLDWTDGDAAVERAMARTDTARLADREVTELSGGERGRVLLARALAQETPALVLDEPTASLDINHQVRVLELVGDLVAEGRAAVAAIHDLDLAARYCDRLLLLAEGRIRAAGPPERVLSSAGLDDAFDTTTAVATNPVTGTPTVAAVDDRPEREATVHVLGGGEAGARAVGACWRAGFDVTLGPVPAGDAAASVAERLDCEAVTVPPFEGLGTGRRAAGTLAAEADVVLDSGGPGSDALDLGSVAAAGDPVGAVLDALGERAAPADD